MFAVMVLPTVACGTDAVGVDACRAIQKAECEAAPACGIVLEPPYHTTGTDVDECIRFYNDQCLHGLASGTDPGTVAVNACVSAIESAATTEGGCAVVADPPLSPACAWLGVSPSAIDASAAIDTAAEEAADAIEEADATEDGGAE